MKKACILMGSPRKEGNTIQLTRPFMDELERLGYECELIWLQDKDIKPCVACRTCQDIFDGFACAIDDDMTAIAGSIMESELIVLASPIYSWYCTAPMKAAIDRLVYGMNKYFGKERGPAIWAGKKMALIATCGYPIEKGSDAWEDGMKRYCKHSQLQYVGMLTERDLGYHKIFMDEEKERHAREFAQQVADI